MKGTLDENGLLVEVVASEPCLDEGDRPAPDYAFGRGWRSELSRIVAAMDERRRVLRDVAYNLRLNGESNVCLLCGRGTEMARDTVSDGHDTACPLVRIDAVIRQVESLDTSVDLVDTVHLSVSIGDRWKRRGSARVRVVRTLTKASIGLSGSGGMKYVTPEELEEEWEQVR